MKAENLQYTDIETSDVFHLINQSRKGISYNEFEKLTSRFAISNSEWSKLLHISERTMQRYRKEKRKFDTVHSEKILQLVLLFNQGELLFGNKESFTLWLKSPLVALGKVKPLSLLDSSFGIDIVKDELSRIEHGVLA